MNNFKITTAVIKVNCRKFFILILKERLLLYQLTPIKDLNLFLLVDNPALVCWISDISQSL